MKKRKTKANKYTLLHRSNERFARNNLQLLSENAKLKDDLVVAGNKLDDMTQVKETIQLQNQTLEKRLFLSFVNLTTLLISCFLFSLIYIIFSPFFVIFVFHIVFYFFFHQNNSH